MLLFGYVAFVCVVNVFDVPALFVFSLCCRSCPLCLSFVFDVFCVRVFFSCLFVCLCLLCWFRFFAVFVCCFGLLNCFFCLIHPHVAVFMLFSLGLRV